MHLFFFFPWTNQTWSQQRQRWEERMNSKKKGVQFWRCWLNQLRKLQSKTWNIKVKSLCENRHQFEKTHFRALTVIYMADVVIRLLWLCSNDPYAGPKTRACEGKLSYPSSQQTFELDSTITLRCYPLWNAFPAFKWFPFTYCDLGDDKQCSPAVDLDHQCVHLVHKYFLSRWALAPCASVFAFWESVILRDSIA